MEFQKTEHSTPSSDSLIKKLLKDSLIYIPASVVPALATVAAIYFLTKSFIPEVYGRYALIVAIINFLALICSSWIRQSILRYKSSYKATNREIEFNSYLATLLSIVSAFVFLSGSLIYSLISNHLGSFKAFFWPSLTYLIVDLWFVNLCAVLMADLRPSFYSLAYTMNGALYIGFVVFFLYIKKDIVLIIWSMVISETLIVIPLLFMLKIISFRILFLQHKNFQQYIKAEATFIKKWAVYGFPLIGWFIGAYLLNVSDNFLLHIFRGSREVGIYNPNYRLVTGVLGLFSTPLLSAAHAMIMNVAGSGGIHKNIEELISRFSRIYILCVFPIFAFISLFSKDIVSLFLGEDYREGYLVIPIIMFGYLMWNFAMYGHKGLELKEKTKLMLIYVIICAATNILLNLMFIPLFGYIGAAITSCVGLSLYPFLVYFGTKRHLRWIIPWKTIARSIIAAGITGALIIVVKYYFPNINKIAFLALIMFLGAIIYIICLCATGEVGAKERRNIANTLHNIIKVRGAGKGE